MLTTKTFAILLGVCACALAAPQNRVIDLLTDDIDDSINIIDDTKPKLLEAKKIPDDIPLGSQFAVGYLFPDRVGVVTGHRMPIELFPIETQAQILDLPAPEIVESKYVDSSSFRRSQAITPELRFDETVLSGLSHETDKYYADSLHVFAPVSFF
jgi:hypothetical protein